MSQAVLDFLTAKLGDAVLETHSHCGDDTAVLRPDQWRKACTLLREDPSMAFDMLVDLCGVDYPERDPRFEVVLHLYSISKGHRVRLKARVGNPAGEGAEIDSVMRIWTGADWFERETWDMLGIKFRGHADLRRILMYPEFEGHPLRKDYPAQLTQPLIPYRTEEEAGLPLGKLAPFREDEGMSFGRQQWTKTDVEPS